MHVSIFLDHGVLNVVFILCFTASDRHVDTLPCRLQRRGADKVADFSYQKDPEIQPILQNVSGFSNIAYIENSPPNDAPNSPLVSGSADMGCILSTVGMMTFVSSSRKRLPLPPKSGNAGLREGTGHGVYSSSLLSGLMPARINSGSFPFANWSSSFSICSKNKSPPSST